MLKKPLKYEEQVDKLKEHGMLVEDKDQAVTLLKQINYYRFTGDALQFRKGPKIKVSRPKV